MSTPAPGAPPPPWLWPRAAYVHVPFCAHRCSYCDFAIAVGQDEQRDRYVEAVATELARLGGPRPGGPRLLGGGRAGHGLLGLSFGVPGQTPDEWESDLRRVLELHPEHVATYGLTYEKGTPLWKERQRGGVRPLDEEAELGLYACAIDVLESAGFE